ncbi:MAG: TerB family tellurite resistance protein [Myxococcota bacterium]
MEIDDRYLIITDLLLGAVYADDRLDGEEDAAVRRLLTEAIGADSLPIEIEARIENFEPDNFDLEDSAKAFEAVDDVSKRKLLELVAAVFDADGEVDFAEDDYLRSLAEALGMEESEWKDLAIEYDVEDIQEVIEVVISLPPPPPIS